MKQPFLSLSIFIKDYKYKVITMKRIYFITLLIFGVLSCSDESTNSVSVDDGSNSNLMTYKISNDKVFSTNSEQVSDANFNTITAREGFITSKITSSLGPFEEAKDFDCNLQITRQTEDPYFEAGSYSLAGPEIIVNVFLAPNDTTFAVVNAVSEDEYKNLEALNLLDELRDKFVFHSSPENTLVIEEVKVQEDLKADNSGNYKVGSQLLKGYAIIHLMEVNSKEIFNIRLDFSLINEIRLSQ